MIRNAEQGDAGFLAWGHSGCVAQPLAQGWFDIALGKSESGCLEFIRRLTCTVTQSWWHYSRFLIAQSDGKPVAALCAFRAGDGYSLSYPAISEAATGEGMSAEEQNLIWQRGAYLFTCTTASGDDDWTIENVATLPGYRGRGCVGILLSQALQLGRQSAAQCAQVSCVIGNEPAERAYRKAGFQFAQESRHPEFEAVAGTPGVRRYVVQLQQ